MQQELIGIISDLEYAAYNLCNGRKDTDLPIGIMESTGAEDSLLIAIRDLKQFGEAQTAKGGQTEVQVSQENGDHEGLFLETVFVNENKKWECKFDNNCMDKPEPLKILKVDAKNFVDKTRIEVYAPM